MEPPAQDDSTRAPRNTGGKQQQHHQHREQQQQQQQQLEHRQRQQTGLVLPASGEGHADSQQLQQILEELQRRCGLEVGPLPLLAVRRAPENVEEMHRTLADLGAAVEALEDAAAQQDALPAQQAELRTKLAARRVRGGFLYHRDSCREADTVIHESGRQHEVMLALVRLACQTISDHNDQNRSLRHDLGRCQSTLEQTQLELQRFQEQAESDRLELVRLRAIETATPGAEVASRSELDELKSKMVDLKMELADARMSEANAHLDLAKGLSSAAPPPWLPESPSMRTRSGSQASLNSLTTNAGGDSGSNMPDARKRRRNLSPQDDSEIQQTESPSAGMGSRNRATSSPRTRQQRSARRSSGRASGSQSEFPSFATVPEDSVLQQSGPVSPKGWQSSATAQASSSRSRETLEGTQSAGLWTLADCPQARSAPPGTVQDVLDQLSVYGPMDGRFSSATQLAEAVKEALSPCLGTYTAAKPWTAIVSNLQPRNRLQWLCAHARRDRKPNQPLSEISEHCRYCEESRLPSVVVVTAGEGSHAGVKLILIPRDPQFRRGLALHNPGYWVPKPEEKVTRQRAV